MKSPKTSLIAVTVVMAAILSAVLILVIKPKDAGVGEPDPDARQDYSAPGAPVSIPQAVTQPAQGSHCFLASAAPKPEARKKQWSDELAIIWDVSLSGSRRNLEHEMKMLDIIFADKKNANVHLYFLNNRLKKIAAQDSANDEYKVTGGNWEGLKNVLKTAIFDGGTDFSQINLKDIRGDEILFFSDGISTLSDADFLKDAKSDVNPPVHCIVSSSSADYSVMKLIAGRTKGKFVNVNALSSERLKDELLNETPDDYVRSSIEPPASEPEMRAECHHRRKGRERGVRDTESSTLINAVSTAQSIRKWWNTDFQLPGEPKDPAPGDDRHAGGMGGWDGGLDELPGGLSSDSDNDQSHRERNEFKGPSGFLMRNVSMVGGRNRTMYHRARVRRIVSRHMPSLLYAYNKHLRGKPYVYGIITVRFAVDEFGKVISAQVVLSTMNDSVFENIVVEMVKNFVFEGIDIPGDVTEVTYPLIFDTGGNYNGTPEENKADSVKRVAIRVEADSLLRRAEEERRKKLAEFGHSVYLEKLTGNIADDYQTYLKSRNKHANSPKFYFDMAYWFYKHNDKETALRILTSIAELELESAPLYRMLGYRFKEYGEYALQKYVCRKAMEWRPMEQQGYRDYALALADNGEAQAALDSLRGLLTKSYSAHTGNRNRGIEEVVIMEINRLIAKNPRLSVSKIDRRLRSNMPVDVRVVLNWNMNNTHVDLSVADPTGEETTYIFDHFSDCTCRACMAFRSGGNVITTIGGRLSAGNISGYGPKQFVLKKAVKGKYSVYATYQTAREFAAAEPITVMAEIYTKYGGKDEQRRVVTMQLSKERGARNNWERWPGGSGDWVLVGEFEF